MLIDHAKFKLRLLNVRGIQISEAQVVEAVRRPDRVEPSRRGRFVAQKGMDETLVLRVIFERHEKLIEVITMYPGRRDRYES